jgi:hypothetical protein
MDYGLDEREVYTQLTKHFIAESYSMRIFDFATIQFVRHGPSWVPDYSKSNRYNRHALVKAFLILSTKDHHGDICN